MLRAEPQRHRGTEKTQSRPTSQTRRHEDTKPSQRPPTNPLSAEAQRRRESTRIQRVARFWPPNGGQGPLDRAIAPNARVRRDGPVQRPALRERRPRHFSPLFNGWEGHTSFPDRREARWNRRAPGASAGGPFGRDKRSRLERTNVSPAVGDRQIAGCSAVNPRHCPSHQRKTLRVFVSLCLRRGRASLRLCGSAFLPSVFRLCVSVSLWFFGRRLVGTA